MTRPLHQDDARRVVIGTVTILALLAVGFVGGIVQTGGALPGKSYTYVDASFEDVGTLKTGKQIKQGGLPVGTVSGIEYDDGTALVTMRFDGDKTIYRDASAYVANSSALGKKFMAFDPGTPSAGVMPEGGSIPLAQTSAATSLEDILDAFDPQTRGALQTSLNELSTGVTGHSEDLNAALRSSPDLLADLQSVAQAAVSPDAQLTELLSSADALVSRFDGREQQLASLVRNLDSTVGALGIDDGQPLEEAVSGLPATLDTTKQALDALAPPLVAARSALRTIRPGGRALGAATPDLRSFVRDAVRPLDRVPMIGAQATPVVRDLTATLTDARPLVEPLRQAVSNLDTLLFPFAPYAADTGRFFAQNDLLSGTLNGDNNRHYFAAALTGVGLFSASGVPDPLYRGEYYPLPGTSYNHATVTESRSTKGGRR